MMNPRVQFCCCILPLPLMLGIIGLGWKRRSIKGEVIGFPRRERDDDKQ